MRNRKDSEIDGVELTQCLDKRIQPAISNEWCTVQIATDRHIDEYFGGSPVDLSVFITDHSVFQ